MSRPLPSLNALRAFEAAARHLSFTRAAEELNVTQAAISHQIKALEARLGLPLFRRGTRSLLLTDEGQRLFPAVREAFDRLAVAVAAVGAGDGVGTLTVAVLPSFAAKWLVPRLEAFQRRHPDIDLRISATERLVDYGRDGIDVGVRFGAGAWPGLHARFIAAETVTPVCSPVLLERLREPADLAHVPLLHEDMNPLVRFPDWPTWLAAAGVDGVEPGRGLRFSHTHMMLQAAIDGRGVALGQLVLAGDDIAAGRLATPFPLRLDTGYGYHVASLPAVADRAKVRAFRDWVAADMTAAIDPA